MLRIDPTVENPFKNKINIIFLYIKQDPVGSLNKIKKLKIPEGSILYLII